MKGYYRCDRVYDSNFRRGWRGLVTGAGFGAPENVRLSLCDRFGHAQEAVQRLQQFMESK